jgi:isoleucyl-tRNA synthetase
VAAVDYRNDVRISREILERAVEAYRRVRNTARFLLGNLADFDPSRDCVPDAELIELDRFVLDRLQQLVERCRRAYDAFEFHLVYHALNNFCSVDLSSLYLDIAKDRLYCEPAGSRARRSGQTAMYAVLDGMVRLMAPILSFTAEEIWQHMPADPARPASVHLADIPAIEAARRTPELAAEWEKILEVRAAVTKVLEGLRQRGEIRHSLEAHVTLAPNATLRPILDARAALLADVLIVSQVDLVPEGALDGPVLPPGVAVAARPAEGTKCPRCWNYRTDGGVDPTYPDLCARCAGVIAATGAMPAAT